MHTDSGWDKPSSLKVNGKEILVNANVQGIANDLEAILRATNPANVTATRVASFVKACFEKGKPDDMIEVGYATLNLEASKKEDAYVWDKNPLTVYKSSRAMILEACNACISAGQAEIKQKGNGKEGKEKVIGDNLPYIYTGIAFPKLAEPTTEYKEREATEKGKRAGKGKQVISI